VVTAAVPVTVPPATCVPAAVVLPGGRISAATSFAAGRADDAGGVEGCAHRSVLIAFTAFAILAPA
jgi:hypothetical protein